MESELYMKTKPIKISKIEKKISMKKCIVCYKDKVKKILDIGLQPISNRFLREQKGKEFLHPIIMGQCIVCGLVQLIDPVKSKELMPRFDWITFNEPEGHLDHLVSVIKKLPGITKESKILGISYKENSTLERFNKLGFNKTISLDLSKDIGNDQPGAGVETIQEKFQPDLAENLIQKYGKSDIIIVRHILEHAYNPLRFMKALKIMIKKSGFLVFEIPDCTAVFDNQDYTTIWEDHISYFTPETFQNTLVIGGYNIYHFKTYPYPFENSLVAIVQPNNSRIKHNNQDINVDDELKRIHSFANNLGHKREQLNKFLSSFRQNHGKIAIFGAGHLACMFINLMGIKDLIEFVVDDHPNKRGLFMPGSKLPIYASDYLIKKKIKLCLSSLSPESEKIVILNNNNFISSGGQFASIFPTSNNSLQIS